MGAKGLVPKGLNDPSLAIHCQECAQNQARPVGNGMIRFAVDGRVIMGEDRSRRGESHCTLRDGSIIGQAPGNKLPGYDHAVPTGQKPMRRLASQPNLLLL